MSEADPPPPKPMSLKDRIKAFESSSSSGGPAPNSPPSRPTPGRFTGGWKPKPREGSDDGGAIEPPVSSASNKAFSAADAAQSIGAGAGSLKERMALLQGKGAFGASGNPKPPPPPKPEKPYKWKIPSQDEDKPVVAPLDTPATEEGTTEQAQTVKHDSPQPAEAALEPEPEDDEESARRAALAARMAKLGGAKFGMGPPAFIRKDSALKSEDEDEAKNTPTPPTVEQPSEETISTEKPSLAEDYADASPSLLPPSDTTSIPVKPTVEELSASASPTAAQEENDLHVEPEELLDSPEVPVPPSVSEPRTTAPDQGECNSPASSPCFLSESTNPYDAVIGEDSTNPYDSMPLSTNPYDQPLSTSTNPYDPAPPPIVAEEEEDEEETRKRRLKEKMSKMGGFNPFAKPIDGPARATPPSSPPEEVEEPVVVQDGPEVDEEIGRKAKLERMKKMGGMNPFAMVAPTARRASEDSTVPSKSPPPSRKASIPVSPELDLVDDTPPPPPPRRTSVPVPVGEVIDEELTRPPREAPSPAPISTEEEDIPLPPPPRRSISEEETSAILPSRRTSVPAPARALPLPVPEDGDEAPPPPPRRTSIPAPARVVSPPVPEEEDEAPPPPPRRAAVPVPSTAAEDEEPLVPPPRQTDISSRSPSVTEDHAPPPPPRTTRPPLPPSPPKPITVESRTSSIDTYTTLSGDSDSEIRYIPPPHRQLEQEVSTPTLSVTPTDGEGERDLEILSDDEGDPIDPSYHSPSRRTSFIQHGEDEEKAGETMVTGLSAQEAESEDPVPAPAPVPEDEEDSEAIRRKTIAERMAKLGGVRFGMAPPIPSAQTPKSPRSQEASVDSGLGASTGEDEEEDEAARRERIRKKMAAGAFGARMGGYGMVAPSSAPPPAPEEVSNDEHVTEEAEEEEDSPRPPPPPPRATRPPSKRMSVDAPVASPAPPLPPPPPPTSIPQEEAPALPPPRSVAPNSPASPLPPPPPSATRPPPRSVAPPPPPSEEPTPPPSSIPRTSWEMPDLSMGSSAPLDLSLGSPPASATAATPAAPVMRHLTADELQSVWGKVGVMVIEQAHSLSPTSTSQEDWIRNVLTCVPTARVPSSSSTEWGYPIYEVRSEKGVSVRAADIQPGDILSLDATTKFHGRKGLGSYNQVFEHGYVGIISEWEPKKGKGKIISPSGETGKKGKSGGGVESVSLKMDDLKSGRVRVWRVLDA